MRKLKKEVLPKKNHQLTRIFKASPKKTKEKILSHHERIFKKDFSEFSTLIRSQKEFPLEKFKHFHRNQEQRIQRWHRSGGSGREIAQRRSDLIDILLKNIFYFLVGKKSELTQRLCVVAVGGYGRGEMNPYSDVDIMFLYEGKKLLMEKEELIRSILMVLWDIGLKVGHSTRSVEEALTHANAEMVSKTAMLECRFLAGDENTFKNFRQKFRKKCVQGQEEKYITWRLENIKKLREKFGKTIFMQEPHIKSGSGGLRDYQNLLWLSIFYHEEPTLTYLIKKKFLRESEKKILELNYDFLLRVRNAMHYQEKRAADQLTLRLQGKIAASLGYTQRSIIRRSEAFMKEYYEKAREIYLLSSAVIERMKTPSKRSEVFNISSLFKMKKRKRERLDGFIIKENFIFPENQDIFLEPARMMRAFHLAQTRLLEFSAELSDLLKRDLFLVNRQFQKSPEIRKTFLTILSKKGQVGRILRLMHNLGFLGKYIPEFGALTCLVQHEFYHLYTADEHTLVCLEKIDELLFSPNKKLSRYSALLKNLEDPAMLYLAMLLHDIGKAANVANHAEASIIGTKKVAARLELSEERSELLFTLVEAHGELATVARTRDLDDSTTITAFANQIKNIPTLHALMILTLADGMGTSDSQWSDWKEQLVWNLYDQTKRYFELGKTFFEKNRQDFAAAKKALRELMPADFEEEIEAHFEQMPERYFRTVEPFQIEEHLKLFRSFFEKIRTPISGVHHSLEAEVQWKEHPESGHTEVLICGWDREQLLERIAASFLAAGINILSADIFTRQDHVTLDIFRVTSVRPDPLLTQKEKKIMEGRLQELLRLNGNNLEDRFSKSPTTSLEESEIMLSSYLFIDNESHPLYTLLEIETPDRQGLFYDLLGALHYEGISIDCARIATEMKAAFDTFYILGADKKKVINEAVMKILQQRLVSAITRETKNLS